MTKQIAIEAGNTATPKQDMPTEILSPSPKTNPNHIGPPLSHLKKEQLWKKTTSEMQALLKKIPELQQYSTIPKLSDLIDKYREWQLKVHGGGYKYRKNEGYRELKKERMKAAREKRLAEAKERGQAEEFQDFEVWRGGDVR
jgi:hypothetical protein